MKKLLAFLAGVFASFLVFGQLQTTNSSFILGWNYPTNEFSTNITFKIAILTNNIPNFVGEYRFLKPPTTITNNSYSFETTNRISFVPGVNEIVMFAVSSSGLWSDQSKSLVLPGLAQTTQLKTDKIE